MVFFRIIYCMGAMPADRIDDERGDGVSGVDYGDIGTGCRAL